HRIHVTHGFLDFQNSVQIGEQMDILSLFRFSLLHVLTTIEMAKRLGTTRSEIEESEGATKARRP
ncbi:hypothetical protein K0M31_005473, partial [Melipona bicolor]